ncbi:MAG: carboxypeptidase-like regulatory domain-containing protein, partial [Terrimicrobiaceae bacterium]|nr:carboxypeptidase-like regulatory domain-containing protein [Terrimicrobiaceae bacterium]
MRRYVVASLVLLAFIIVLGVWLYHPAEKQASSSQPPQTKPNVAASPTSTPWLGPVRKQLPGGAYEPSDPRWAEVHQKDKIDKNWEWKMPINFYGKVIDQDGQPVAGAKVKFIWTNLSMEGSSQSETSSDGQGNFMLENKEGRFLQAFVTKPGYYTAKQQNQDSFDYAGFWDKRYYEPNAEAPVLFRLRKQGAEENLFTGRIDINVPSGGVPTQIPFSRNPADSWARVEVKAWPSTERYPPRIFDWRAIITVPGGDLQPCNDEFPFTAPEGNYQPAIEINMPATAEKWRRGVGQQ